MKHENYWNQYYKNSGSVDAPPIPSQFAAFFLMEIGAERPVIVEFGCGNGRDSLFFSQFGHKVIGVDSSSEAIQSCIKKCAQGTAEFLRGSASDENTENLIAQRIAVHAPAKVCVYARFFLHAIDEDEQSKFLKMSRNLIGDDGFLALEFRTMRDRSQEKITPDHYRRFINPLDFMHDARQQGFKTLYFSEGFGMAKYKSDDAHVARFLLGADVA